MRHRLTIPTSFFLIKAKTYCLKMQYHMRDERPTSMGSLYVKTKQGSNPAVTRFQKSGHQGSDWKSLQLNLSLDSQTKVSGDVYVTDNHLQNHFK